MARKSVWLVAIAAVVLALGVFGASAAPPSATDATAVSHWNLIAVSTLTGLPGPAGGAPPAAQIHMGMVQGAVYDAVNAIEPKHHRPYLLKRRFSARASKEAAVATAAYGVLKSIVSTVPALTVEARAAFALADRMYGDWRRPAPPGGCAMGPARGGMCSTAQRSRA